MADSSTELDPWMYRRRTDVERQWTEERAQGRRGESTLESDLMKVLNFHSAESTSDTPDYVLAQYLIACLAAWNAGIEAREQYYRGN